MKTYTLEVCINAEGHKLAYLGETNGDSAYRIAGPKAWGGAETLATLKIEERDLITFLKGYAPDVVKKLAEETQK